MMPRVMLAGTSSGSGKTTITCGILQALVDRGMDVASFKCGPDYIDPMFHSRVIGARSKNLDAFFSDDDTLRYLFARTARNADVSVIEGVMGYFDGMRASSTEASSHDVSRRLGCPVILVVDCAGVSVSCVPVIKGFKEFRENDIRGVILNNMSASTFERLRGTIEGETGVRAIGHVPRMRGLSLESRHLGLVMPSEVEDLRTRLREFAERIEGTVDIDMLLGIAGDVPGLDFTEPAYGSIDGSVRIGVAADEAFCFTYEDNLELLERCGAEIIEFSPIHDERLPDVDGIVLSGGYPELHTEALSENRGMLRSIRDAIANGMPCIAECGGFMYLHRRLEGGDGVTRDMVGTIDGTAFRTPRLSRFGYVTLTARDDQMLLSEGDEVKGHEFHYWDSEDCGDDMVAERTNGARYDCVHASESSYMGFPHLFFHSNPDAVLNFLSTCQRHRDG